MASNLRSAVGERCTAIRHIYWRPASRLVAALYGALGLGSFLLAEFASAKVQKAALLGVLIPRVPAWIWLAGGVVLVLLLGVEGAVREQRDVRAKHADEMNGLRAEKEAAIADQQVKHDAAFAAERTKHQDALSDQQSRHEAAIAAERAKQDALRKRLRDAEDRSYEDDRPVLEGRIVPWPGQDSFNYCLQVKILSPRPLSTILIIMPNSDPRFGYARRDIEAPRHGPHAVFWPGEWIRFRPGEWITVGGVNIPRTEAEKIMGLSAPDTVTVWARCRDENRTIWDDIVVNATFELAGVNA